MTKARATGKNLLAKACGSCGLRSEGEYNGGDPRAAEVIRRFWKKYPLADSTLRLYEMLHQARGATIPGGTDNSQLPPFRTCHAGPDQFISDLGKALAAFSEMTRRPQQKITLVIPLTPEYDVEG